MADKHQLRLLKEDITEWNIWRDFNPTIKINISKAGLKRANLREANLSRADMRGVDLEDADLTGAELDRANLGGANLGGAILSNADLEAANLTRANLSGAVLSDVQLFEANLRQAELIEAQLNRAILVAADLTRANLTGANLTEADLSRADLTEANLTEADLSRADLTGANLTEADLSRTNFSEAELSEANLSRATLDNTIFGEMDLSTVKGLEEIKHFGPSHVSINTIFRSNGHIPEIFLRETGAPDIFIDYMPSLMMQPIQYYSCFISYSSKDQDFAERLHADLQNKGVRCWLASHDMRIGDKIRPRIDECIRIHDKLLVVLSQHSIKSQWVEDEVEKALEKECSKKKSVLFPVRLDDTITRTRQAWAVTLRQRHIGDFTRWKEHDFYHQVFPRLLRDLQSVQTKKKT